MKFPTLILFGLFLCTALFAVHLIGQNAELRGRLDTKEILVESCEARLDAMAAMAAAFEEVNQAAINTATKCLIRQIHLKNVRRFP